MIIVIEIKRITDDILTQRKLKETAINILVIRQYTNFIAVESFPKKKTQRKIERNLKKAKKRTPKTSNEYVAQEIRLVYIIIIKT